MLLKILALMVLPLMVVSELLVCRNCFFAPVPNILKSSTGADEVKMLSEYLALRQSRFIEAATQSPLEGAEREEGDVHDDEVAASHIHHCEFLDYNICGANFVKNQNGNIMHIAYRIHWN